MKTSTAQATMGNGPDEVGGAQLAPGQMGQPSMTNPAAKLPAARPLHIKPKLAKGKAALKKPIRSIADLKDAAAKSKAKWNIGRQGGSSAGGLGEEDND